MQCSYHPDREAVNTCSVCGQPVCNVCNYITGTNPICRNCYEKRPLPVQKDTKTEGEIAVKPKTKPTLVQTITAVAILFVLGIFGTCAICICTQPSKTPTTAPTQTTQPPIQQPAYSGPEVEYEITGSAQSVSVTLENATGGTEQESTVYLPHTYTYDQFPGSFLYISAQNNGEAGSVTVTIRVNGNVIKTSTSSGAYVIASASASK